MKLIDLEEPYKVEIELNGHKCSVSVIGKLVDAVPVVRCKECKYYNPPFEVDGKRFEGDCDFHEWYRAAPEEYDFCSKGVKRKDV